MQLCCIYFAHGVYHNSLLCAISRERIDAKASARLLVYTEVAFYAANLAVAISVYDVTRMCIVRRDSLLLRMLFIKKL